MSGERGGGSEPCEAAHLGKAQGSDAGEARETMSLDVATAVQVQCLKAYEAALEASGQHQRQEDAVERGYGRKGGANGDRNEVPYIEQNWPKPVIDRKIAGDAAFRRRAGRRNLEITPEPLQPRPRLPDGEQTQRGDGAPAGLVGLKGIESPRL